MGEPSVKKSTCERYDVRSGHGHDWAVIMLDPRGGVLQINSDYGNWSYCWPHHGRESFKHFLVELGRDTDYFMGKLGGLPKHYRADDTLQLCLREVCAQRRRGEITKEVARGAYEVIQNSDNGSFDELIRDVDFDSYSRKVFPEPWESLPRVVTHDPGLLMFVERIWPVFVAAIREELQTEENQDGP